MVPCASHLRNCPRTKILARMVPAPDEYPVVSGGAIFHTGYLRVVDSSFVENQVEKEGPAIMSIGVLQTLSNVSFVGNAYHCRAGQYSHVVLDEVRGRHASHVRVVTFQSEIRRKVPRLWKILLSEC